MTYIRTVGVFTSQGVANDREELQISCMKRGYQFIIKFYSHLLVHQLGPVHTVN
jgi:hypothetical protein